MLGKLIKYEWKSLSRQFLVMLAILAGTTLVSSLIIVSINFEFDDVNENYSLFMLIGSVLIYYLGLIVCSIGTSLIVAIRFYKSCYTDAAYLTHTLPVSARQLVGAKTIASCLIQFLSSITVFLFYNRIFCRDHCSRIRFRYHKLYRNYVLCNVKHRVPTVTWRNIDTVLCIPDWIQSDWLHHRMLYSARMCQSWPALYKTPHSWCNSCVFHCYHGYAGHYLSGNASSLW